MKRLAALALVAMTLPGCFVIPSTAVYTPPRPPLADATALRPVYLADGASLADANHAVRQYLAQLAPEARLLEIHATMVGTNGRVARTSAWEFIFEVPVVQNVPVAIAEPVPANTEPAVKALAIAAPKTTQLKLVYTGQGQLLAPRYGDAFSRNQPIDFSKTILLDEAIATAQDIGMGVTDPGLEVSLTTTPAGRIVYSIDSGFAERTIMGVRSTITWSSTVERTSDGFSGSRSGYDQSTAVRESYLGWDEPDSSDSRGTPAVIQQPSNGASFDRGAPGQVVYQPSPQPRQVYVRGKYLIDALSGDIIQRPTRL